MMDKEDNALEAIIVAALNHRPPITDEYVAEENLPEVTEEELRKSREQIPDVLAIIKRRNGKEC